MSTRIPFLSTLVLISAAFPAQLLRVGRPGGAPATGGRLRRYVTALTYPGLFALVALLTWYLAPTNGVLRWPAAGYWWGIAALLGLALPGIEIGVGVLAVRLRGRAVTGIARHERAGPLVPALLMGTAEEVVFRGVAIPVLGTVLGWPAGAAIAVTGVCYGLNHLYFGPLTVLQKCVTGVLLGLAFTRSGSALAVPLVAHLVQNLVVLLVLPQWTQRR